MSEFDKAYKRLQRASRIFVSEVDRLYDEIKEALNPENELPENCPSHGSLAELIFREVKEAFREVEGAIKDVENAIYKEGK